MHSATSVSWMTTLKASSSSKPIRGWTYDVFLSFRGEDVRYGFLDHLYGALHQKGLTAFKDDDALRRGKVVSKELLKAINNSRIALIVFSKNYADSGWCLDELAQIMKCHDEERLLAIPVFYHVEPSDVRELKEYFGPAFEKVKMEFPGELDKLNAWKKALADAGGLSGYPISDNVKEGELAFINRIVENFLSEIQPQGMETNLKGIKSHIEKFDSLLDTEATKEVRMIGIWGIGGIGKTTIAQALYRRISDEFEGCSFVENVRENSKKGICTLQEKILEDITNHKYELMDQESGARKIQTRLCNLRVLLVLDDVDDVNQLNFLAAECEWFGAGSRIVITTRDKSLLPADAYAKYEPDPLSYEQALELFCRHAFRRNNPCEGYEELSKRAVTYTHRLPLAVKVIGSYFYGRAKDVWGDGLRKLANTLKDDIFERLKISFDGLDDDEKKIFLHIAFFLKGYDKESATRILDACGLYAVIGISVLTEKSLITVSDNRLDMHDLIQDMGLRIIRQSYPNCWIRQDEELADFITENKGLEDTEAIVVPRFLYDEFYTDHKPMSFTPDVFKNMRNLRLLKIGGKFTSSEPIILPDKLRWLGWNHYPFSSLLASAACPRKLIGLRMSFGAIENLWTGYKEMGCLKYISLDKLRYLKRFPDISGAPNLERLSLLRCEKLVEVHESLGCHERLVFLEISGCSQLVGFPFEFRIKSLEGLNLSDCGRLEQFPEVSSCMVKLSYINLDDCQYLENLPRSLFKLKSLEILRLQGCWELEKLPDELQEMKSLKELWLGIGHYYKALRSGWGSKIRN